MTDSTIRPARGFAGHALKGEIVRLDARRRGYDVLLTVRQEQGPSQRFVIYPDHLSRAGLIGPVLPRIVPGAAVVSVVLAAANFLLMFGQTDEYGVHEAGLSAWACVPAMVVFLVVAGVCGRLAFWTGFLRRYQRCSHAAGIYEAVRAAGDPRGQKWAAEAVSALRSDEFCRDSGMLHLMAAKPHLFEVVANPPDDRDAAPEQAASIDVDSNIAELQALRLYSRRWGKNE